jgi:hypothetical protein
MPCLAMPCCATWREPTPGVPLRSALWRCASVCAALALPLAAGCRLAGGVSVTHKAAAPTGQTPMGGKMPLCRGWLRGWCLWVAADRSRGLWTESRESRHNQGKQGGRLC